MNPRELAAEYRLAHWAQMIRERVDSGISVRTYCEQTGIHENTYYYWQRKLREATCAGLQVVAANEKTLVPNGWTSLCVGEAVKPTQGLTVEVGECRIMVCADTDPELLAKVFRILKAL